MSPPPARPISVIRLCAIASAFICCLVSPTAGSQYDYGFNVHARLSRRFYEKHNTGVNGQKPFVVSGLGGHRNGTMPPRQEIRRMENDTDLWTLYILGLNMMQYTDQSNFLSYYQIAGTSPRSLCFGSEFCYGTLAMFTDITIKASMVSLGSNGTALRRYQAAKTLATVPTFRSCFSPGIGRTWPCTRCVGPHK